MHNKKYFFVFFATVLSINFFIFSRAKADDSTTTPQVLGLQAPTVPLLIQEINQAKANLANVSLNHNLSPVYKNIKNKKTGKTTKTLTGYSLTGKDIALAILDPATNNIIITVGKQSGKSMTFTDPAVNVKLKSFNGVNSKFEITQPANGTVIALKYLISGADSGSKAGIENSLSEAVYVPYSAGLSDPAVIAYGSSYLDNIIKSVTDSLQTLPSQAIPGQSITQAIPPAMIKALVYAEHTDTSQALNGNMQNSINQLNVLFATNGGDTYKYSVSTANARGIAQFIPSTYTALVQRHPEAGLIPDFVAGMSDHYNSIKAMYLLLDDYAGAVRVKAAQGFASGRVFEYAAASYNGGTTRVANAVNTYGSDWNADRSGQLNSDQAQINNLSSQIKNLKAKIKKTSDKKTKASLQSQLNTAQTQLSSATADLNIIQSATLRNETINYLNKIYKVISVFNDQTV